MNVEKNPAKNENGEKLNWPHQSFTEGMISPERYQVAQIRGIKETEDPTKNDDYKRIAFWMSHPETRGHLRAPIQQITLADTKTMNDAKKELDRYYHNGNRRDENGQLIPDDPNKIIPIVAVNGLEEAIATLVIRLKGDPFEKKENEVNASEENTPKGSGQKEIRKMSKVASIESIVVDPNLQERYHVGTKLMVAALEIIFNRYKGYNGQSASAVRLWIFTDDQAGNWMKNVKFVRSFGFEVIAGNWKEYSKKRGMSDNRDGQQYELTRDAWEITKKEDAEKEPEKGGQRLMLPSDIIDEASLRIPHASTKSN